MNFGATNRIIMKAKILLLQVLLVVAIVLTGCKKEPEEFDVLCSVSATQDFSITLSVNGSNKFTNYEGSGDWETTVIAQEGTSVALTGYGKPVLSTGIITLKIMRGVAVLERTTAPNGETAQISHIF